MSPATKERIDRGTGTGLGAPWNVIVLNDNHNTFEGVAAALSSTLPGVSFDKGLRIADRIHNSGRADRLVGPSRGRGALLGPAAGPRLDDGAARALVMFKQARIG